MKRLRALNMFVGSIGLTGCGGCLLSCSPYRDLDEPWLINVLELQPGWASKLSSSALYWWSKLLRGGCGYLKSPLQPRQAR